MDSVLRQTVRERSGHACEYCRMPEPADCLPFQTDHVVAVKHGGTDDMSNLAWSCFDCNQYKGPNIAGIDPESGSLPRLFHPRVDEWRRHFRVKAGVIVGLTPESRATVAVLRLNLPRRVALRRELIAEGIYSEG